MIKNITFNQTVFIFQLLLQGGWFDFVNLYLVFLWNKSSENFFWYKIKCCHLQCGNNCHWRASSISPVRQLFCTLYAFAVYPCNLIVCRVGGKAMTTEHDKGWNFFNWSYITKTNNFLGMFTINYKQPIRGGWAFCPIQEYETRPKTGITSFLKRCQSNEYSR